MAKKTLSELNLIDNFLFGAVASHEVYGPQAIQIILETILRREVKIKAVHVEKALLPVGSGRHGIRLDAYVEEELAEAFPGGAVDVEPENKEREKPLLPRRSRFYHGRLDVKLLESGRSYALLPNAWVIFITTFDPFGEGRMVYTVKRKVLELPDMEYDDGDTTIFLYTKGTKGDPPRELRELLRYLEETTPANAISMDLARIQSFVDDIKCDLETKEVYMSLAEYVEGEVRDAVGEVMEEADRRVGEVKEEANRKVAESDRRAAESDRRATESERKAVEANRKAAESERRAAEAERKVGEAKEEANRKVAEADRRAADSERNLGVALSRIRELEAQVKAMGG